jgi:hypothetical protein
MDDMSKDQTFEVLCERIFKAIDEVPRATNGTIVSAVINIDELGPALGPRVTLNVIVDMSPENLAAAVGVPT